MTRFKPGDRVVRVPISEASPRVTGHEARGNEYFVTLTGEEAVVREVQGDTLYLVGKGDWPHSARTFRKVGKK